MGPSKSFIMFLRENTTSFGFWDSAQHSPWLACLLPTPFILVERRRLFPRHVAHALMHIGHQEAEKPKDNYQKSEVAEGAEGDVGEGTRAQEREREEEGGKRGRRKARGWGVENGKEGEKGGRGGVGGLEGGMRGRAGERDKQVTEGKK